VSKWEKVRLFAVCEITMGQSPASTSYNLTGDGIPFYQGNADFGEVYPNVRYFCNQPTKIAEKDDILISVRAPIGAVNIAIERCCIGRGLASLRAQKQKLDTKYLFYVLKRKNNELNLKGTGSTFKAINKQILGDLIIPLPPLEKQKQITKTLDTAADLLALQKQQLAELDNLIKSIFYEMFGDPVVNEKGWEIKTLSQIAKDKLSYGSGSSAITYDGVTRYIRITDINDDGTLNEDLVSPSQVSEKYYLNDGDILFARSGATVGKTLRFKKEFGKCIYAGYLIRLVPDVAQVLPDYVYYYTKTNYYKNFIESNKKTVAQPNINAQQFGDLKICVPPLKLQNQFSDIVTKIEEQKAQVRKAINETQTLFDSLMSQYFD
jgi:type I restriction enzyme S subunit